MKKFFLGAAFAAVFAVGTAGAALGVSSTIGNAATDRTHYDTYSNFTIVDTNNPAPFDGYITAVNYYAERAGDVRFVIVDTSDTVTWVSDVVSAPVGPGSVTLPEPVGVSAGSNLGVYSVGQGVVSWEYATDASGAEYTPNSYGLPSVGETLEYEGASGRYYSMNASVAASSSDVCKKGGWKAYPEYKNQGQCVASVVANDKAGK